MNLPAPAPSLRLPLTYEDAIKAIRCLDHIDECAAWADKAAALAVYARQANDDELLVRLIRIRARALRRAGELLLKIEPQPGLRTDLEPPDTDVPRLPQTREQAAKAAGLSERRYKAAIGVARIPQADFERFIEETRLRTFKEVNKFAFRFPRPANGTPRRPRGRNTLDNRSPGLRTILCAWRAISS